MLKETILQSWKEAFKSKDNVLKSAFESVKAKILIEEKSGKHILPLTDDIIASIITKEIKELKETQSFYKPEDSTYNDISRKIEVLSKYLPKQMTTEEVESIITKFSIEEKNKGKLIGMVIKEVGNRYDKSKIAQLVNSMLN